MRAATAAQTSSVVVMGLAAAALVARGEQAVAVSRPAAAAEVAAPRPAAVAAPRPPPPAAAAAAAAAGAAAVHSCGHDSAASRPPLPRLPRPRRVAAWLWCTTTSNRSRGLVLRQPSRSGELEFRVTSAAFHHARPRHVPCRAAPRQPHCATLNHAQTTPSRATPNSFI